MNTSLIFKKNKKRYLLQTVNNLLHRQISGQAYLMHNIYLKRGLLMKKTLKYLSNKVFTVALIQKNKIISWLH